MSNSIPLDWVEKLFARLAIRYGAAWLRQWEGIDIAAVKEDWCRELHGVKPEQLNFGLRYLPADKPPTVGQFRAQCLRMPTEAVPELDWKRTPIPPQVQQQLVTVAAALEARSPRQWARDLRDRKARGEELTMAQNTMLREAERQWLDEGGNFAGAGFTRVDEDLLPPGLRPGDQPEPRFDLAPADTPVFEEHE